MSQAFHRSYARSGYPRQLQSLYESSREIVDTDLAQMKEPEVWDKFRQDAVCYGAMQHRANRIAGDSFMVVPPDNPPEEEKGLAAWYQDALGEISCFKQAQQLLAHGVFRARSYAYPENAKRHLQLGEIGKLKPQEWHLITSLVDVDKDRVQKLKKDDKWGWYLHPASGSSREPRRLGGDDPFISMVWCPEERTLGYGWPALRSVYFMWWAKMEALPLVLHGLERWAMGFTDIEVDENNLAGELGGDATSTRDEALEQFKKHRTDHAYAHGSSTKINFTETSGTGHEIAMGWVEYCDTVIRGAIYGAPLPLGSAEGVGSLARAEVEQDVAQDLIDSDRALKDEKMGGKLMRLLWDWNPQLRHIFPNSPRMPRFVTTSKQQENPLENAQVAAVLLQNGVKLKAEEVYERTGWTMPEKNDETVEGPAAAQNLLAGVGTPGGPGGPFG